MLNIANDVHEQAELNSVACYYCAYGKVVA